MPSYVASPIFVEVELDWVELAVFVLVGELVEGEVPGGYYMEGGRKVRWHLSAALAAAGLTEAATTLRQVTQASGEQAMRDQITTSAAILKMHLSDLPEAISQLRQVK